MVNLLVFHFSLNILFGEKNTKKNEKKENNYSFFLKTAFFGG